MLFEMVFYRDLFFYMLSVQLFLSPSLRLSPKISKHEVGSDFNSTITFVIRSN